MSEHIEYQTDFFAWANEQAVLLRTGRLTVIDAENIAEELESMGRSEESQLINRLAVLLTHLLKWQYQPKFRCASWEATIKVQRRDLRRHIKRNPSLKSALADCIDEAYGDAVIKASAETGLAETVFPAVAPWPWAEIINQDFWP